MEFMELQPLYFLVEILNSIVLKNSEIIWTKIPSIPIKKKALKALAHLKNKNRNGMLIHWG